APALDGVACGLAVAAVADVARPAALARALEGRDHVTLAQLGQRAAVELDEIDVIGGQALEAALDAGEQRGRAPVGAARAAAVTALGEQVVLAPAIADGAADQDLAVLVALRRVDHVEAGVEGAAQQAPHRALAHALV